MRLGPQDCKRPPLLPGFDRRVLGWRVGNLANLVSAQQGALRDRMPSRASPTLRSSHPASCWSPPLMIC
eukprot:3865337-Alexandrium_andersonii.AAC.1